jgi:hypothetical protein
MRFSLNSAFEKCKRLEPQIVSTTSGNRLSTSPTTFSAVQNQRGSKMKNIKIPSVVLLAGMLAGCIGGTSGVAVLGPNHYLIGDTGGLLDFSSSAVRVKIYQDAAQYCSSMGKKMTTINSRARDSGYAQFATAELQFSCI